MSTVPQESIMRRIEALAARTTENGCSEAEAATAASKLSALLDAHNLTMSDIQISEEKGYMDRVQVGNSHMHPVQYVSNAIGKLFDCHNTVFYEGKTEKKSSHFTHIFMQYIGHQEDVSAACHMTTICRDALDMEWETYRMRMGYRKNGEHKNNFMIGMVTRLNARLEEIKSQRHQVSSNGTALVPVKAEQCKRWADEMLAGTKEIAARKATFVRNADYHAGAAAGDKVRLNPEVGA